MTWIKCITRLLTSMIVTTLPPLALASAPPNDDYEAATAIPSLPFAATLDTTEATTAPDDPWCLGQGASVWFAFTPASDMTLIATTQGSNYDTTLSVWTGARGALTNVACNDDYYGLQSRVSVQLSAGVTYWLMVASFGGGPGGSLSFSAEQVAAPLNDDFDAAEIVAMLPFTSVVDTTYATAAWDDPYCAASAATVWYAFTPSADMHVLASAAGSTFYAAISVYTGTRGNLTPVACQAGSDMSIELTAGQTYYFMAGAAWGWSGGVLTFSLSEVHPPPNDDIASATAISSLPFADVVDTTFATTAPSDPWCMGQGATVWYSITPTAPVTLALDTAGSTYMTTVSVYAGPPGGLYPISCQEGSVSRVALQAGRTYYVMVGSFGGTGGTLRFSAVQVPTPVNDDFDAAKVIPGIPYTDAMDTRYAGTAYDDPWCYGAGATVWYAFTPSADMRLEANTFGSDYDTTLSVWTGTRGALTNVACNDQSGGNQSKVIFTARAGVTHWFMVGSWGYSGGGNLVLNVLPGPPPLAISVRLDTFGSVKPTGGAATVSGTVSCSRPTYVWLNGMLKQKLGRSLLWGWYGSALQCRGPATPFTATVYADRSILAGRALAWWVGGRSEAQASGWTFDWETGESAADNTLSTVILRGGPK